VLLIANQRFINFGGLQPTCSTGRGRQEVLPFRGYYEFLDSSGDESDALLGDLHGCSRENGKLIRKGTCILTMHGILDGPYIIWQV